MRKWLNGRAPPCQGGCCGFESRLPLQICGCCLMVKLQPSKLATRVRFPSPAPMFKTFEKKFLTKQTECFKIINVLKRVFSSAGQSNALLRRGPGVRISQDAPFRGVAQMVARMVWDHEVAGSRPVTPTSKKFVKIKLDKKTKPCIIKKAGCC